jgi:hypothetical protein
MAIDIQALKEQLREYDKSLPRCSKRIRDEGENMPSWVFQRVSFFPCVRPEGHEGECQRNRPMLIWPGYEILKELIEIVENAQREK